MHPLSTHVVARFEEPLGTGRHVPYTDTAGKPMEQFSGFAVPASFDVTPVAREGENHVAILSVNGWTSTN